MSDPNLSRGFEIKQLRNGDVLGSAGTGIEVIDGGVRGGENKVIVGRGTYGTDGAYTDDAYLRCVPGNRLVSIFDFVRLPLVTSGDVLDTDTVTLKIHKLRSAVFGDTPAPGLTRKRWLTRGTQGVITAGQAQKLYESNPLNNTRRDDYYTDSRLTDLGFFDGWIAGDQTFNVWIFAARVNTLDTAGTFRPVAMANAANRSTMPAIFGSNHTAAYSYNFTWGSTGATSTVNVPVPCPGTAYEIWVENSSVGGLTVEYAIGLRGAL